MAVSVAIGALALYVLYHTFQRISLGDVVEQMRQVPAQRLWTAGLCVAGAFTMLALNEVLSLRHLKTGVGVIRPFITALIAFPIGHALGQAVLSGGAMRYRMYSPAGLSAMDVGASVVLCNLPYALVFGLALDLSLVFAADQLAPLFRTSAHLLFTLGCIGLIKDAAYLLLVLFRRAPIRIGGWSFNLPTPALTAVHYLVGALDILLISSVLYILLPDSLKIAYLPFLAVYLASSLVGVLSHVPAGFGVLESMLLLLLPDVPPDQLLASVLLYRVIYEVLPLLCALALWGIWEFFARDGVRLRWSRSARSGQRPSALD